MFFNHIGGRRLTKDPTPVEVSIKNYETDVEKTLIEQAGSGAAQGGSRSGSAPEGTGI